MIPADNTIKKRFREKLILITFISEEKFRKLSYLITILG